MKIATWNVNSIRTRLEHVCAWLQEDRPDVVLFQEIKGTQEVFPFEALEDQGYNLAVYGQKSYNGVAIASKFPLEDIQIGLPNRPEDPQARYIEAVTGGVRVASVYVPNGQTVGSEKFAYKLSFMESLTAHMAHLLTYDEAILVGGDYNITRDDQDVYDPIGWREEILCSTAERQALRQLLHLGYTDLVRQALPEAKTYTWWDYRKDSFSQNRGLRIDHVLASSQAVDRLQAAGVDLQLRGLERPSDHAPVWVELS
jgi:exodeoxyribonuclease-3